MGRGGEDGRKELVPDLFRRWGGGEEGTPSCCSNGGYEGEGTHSCPVQTVGRREGRKELLPAVVRRWGGGEEVGLGAVIL